MQMRRDKTLEFEETFKQRTDSISELHQQIVRKNKLRKIVEEGQQFQFEMALAEKVKLEKMLIKLLANNFRLENFSFFLSARVLELKFKYCQYAHKIAEELNKEKTNHSAEFENLDLDLKTAYDNELEQLQKKHDLAVENEMIVLEQYLNFLNELDHNFLSCDSRLSQINILSMTYPWLQNQITEIDRINGVIEEQIKKGLADKLQLDDQINEVSRLELKMQTQSEDTNNNFYVRKNELSLENFSPHVQVSIANHPSTYFGSKNILTFNMNKNLERMPTNSPRLGMRGEE